MLEERLIKITRDKSPSGTDVPETMERHHSKWVDLGKMRGKTSKICPLKRRKNKKDNYEVLSISTVKSIALVSSPILLALWF